MSNTFQRPDVDGDELNDAQVGAVAKYGTEVKTKFGNTYAEIVGMKSGIGDISNFSINNEADGINYETLSRKRFTQFHGFNEFYGTIKDYVMARLGHPVVRIELTDYQILVAIDEAISRLDYHAPDWCTQLMTFRTQKGVPMYKLPKFVMNNLRYVAYQKSFRA